MRIETDVSGMQSPFGYIAAYLVGQLKKMERHGLKWHVHTEDGQRHEASFEEPSPKVKELYEKLEEEPEVEGYGCSLKRD